MKIEQKKFSKTNSWEIIRKGEIDNSSYHLVLAFGSVQMLSDPSFYAQLRENYPNAEILMNSTAGEIMDVEVNDDTISLTAIHFEKTTIKSSVIDVRTVKNSYEAGCLLAKGLEKNNLGNVLVISDGKLVNGSDLVAGLQEFLPEKTILTGGLAGDGSRFSKTLVGLNDVPSEGKVAVIGFYGDKLSVTYGSVGGWDSFGPERLITRSEENVLYEMDDQPALHVYKKYLGEYANELPGSALLFPLSIRLNDERNSIVRTILGVNETDHSMTFAGNMPQGSYAQLMMANLDRLIEGASTAALNSIEKRPDAPDLAILISCVGRKLVLDQRIEEEVEVIRAAYGDKTAITGFYSYGEISPSFNFADCQLHNQTMTITTITEE